MDIPTTPIKYRLDLSATRQKEIGVEMDIDLPSAEPLDVVMPHISPGSPTNSLNHDQRIRNVQVTDAKGHEVVYERLKSGGFRIPSKGPVTVHYTVRADEFSHVRNDISDDYAYINGPAAMMYVKGHDTDLPATVELVNAPHKDWTTASSLTNIKGMPYGFWAASYQDIADSNIFAGTVKSASETVDGVELTVNVHGTPPWNGLRVNGATAEENLQDLKALYKVFTKNFGKFPLERYRGAGSRPEGVDHADKYVVDKHYFHNGPRSAGGFEHYHGHEILLHKSSEEGIKKRYDSDGRAFERGIMAHELTHKLLAKFVTHDGIDSEDLSSVEKTDGLWVTEGITDWTGVMLERQAGLITPEQYADRLEGFYNRYQEDISYNMTSPTDDSMDAHIGNSNYYNKGAVAGSLLDLEIRHFTGGARGMFDVLRGLKDEFGGTGKGHTLDDVERVCMSQVRGNAEGEAAISSFFQKHLRGREPMDIQGALAHVGYQMQEQPATTEPAALDLGDGTELMVQNDGDLELGKCVHAQGHEHTEDEAKTASLPTLGVRIASLGEGKGWKLEGVDRDGPAGEAGLLEFRGKPIKQLSYDEKSGEMHFGFEKADMFTGETRSYEFAVKGTPATVHKLVALENPTPRQAALRQGWLDAWRT